MWKVILVNMFLKVHEKGKKIDQEEGTCMPALHLPPPLLPPANVASQNSLVSFKHILRNFSK